MILKERGKVAAFNVERYYKMKFYAVTWESEDGDRNTDLIKTNLPFEKVCEYYFREHFWLKIHHICEVVPYFNLLEEEDEEFILDGCK